MKHQRKKPKLQKKKKSQKRFGEKSPSRKQKHLEQGLDIQKITLYRLLSEVEVADVLNIEPKTLQNWRCNGTGPEYLKLNGHLVRYKPSVIKQWIANQGRGGKRHA